VRSGRCGLARCRPASLGKLPAERGEGREHVVAQVGPFVVCRVCGAYSGNRAGRLLGACSGALSVQMPRDELRIKRRDRILDGVHPICGTALDCR